LGILDFLELLDLDLEGDFLFLDPDRLRAFLDADRLDDLLDLLERSFCFAIY
jgi:hypothetical protein